MRQVVKKPAAPSSSHHFLSSAPPVGTSADLCDVKCCQYNFAKENKFYNTNHLILVPKHFSEIGLRLVSIKQICLKNVNLCSNIVNGNVASFT